VQHANATRSEPAPSTYLGRDAELAELHAAYEQVVRKGGQLVLVEGPSGVGKTPLLHAFRTKLRLEGGVVLEGRCEPGHAFRPFAEIVERALHFLAEVGHAPSHSMADLGCSQGCHPFWYQHGSLGAGPAGRTDERVVLEQRVRLFDAIGELLCDVAKLRVPVVLLHGIERADRGTIDLLRHLLEEAGPWNESPAVRALFVASARAGVAAAHGDAIEALRTRESTIRISLGRLDHQGVSAYLQNPETVARIIERTGGHPETIELLLTADPLTPEARVARLLGELEPGARALAEALAVLDCPADAELLAAVAGIAPYDGLAAHGRALAAFSSSELVERTVVDGHISFSFARERDREHVYALAAEPRRVSLHRNAMLEFGRRASSDHSAAHHALMAHEIERAIAHAKTASAALAGRHAHAEAAALLERVVRAAGDRPTRELREQLTDLYRLAGDFKHALGHARALASDAPADVGAAKTLGELLRLAGHLDEALARLEDARRLALADAPKLAEVDAQLAELHYRRSAYDRAEHHANLAIAAARARGDVVVELDGRNTLAKVALARRDESAVDLFEENRRLAADAGLGRQEAQAITSLGIALLRMRDLARAESAFDEAASVARVAGDLRAYAIAIENLAVLAHVRRDYAGAQARYHEAVGLMKRLGDRTLLARAATNLGELYSSLGELARAKTLADFATRVGGAAIPPVIEAEIAVLRGRIEPEPRSARASFQTAREIYARLGDAQEATSMLELAWTFVRERDAPNARALLSELPPQENPSRACEIQLATAAALALLGESGSDPARHALALAEEAQDPELVLRSLLALARAHIERGEAASAAKIHARAERVEAQLTSRVPAESMEGWIARPLRAELVELGTRVGSSSDRVVARPNGARTRQRARWAAIYPELVGESPQMDHVRSLLDKVAPTDALVLVRGESGTGKELVADALHRNSPRRTEPLVKINCAALVESLLLSELFGHERGAFTGASARKKGRFEVAHKGTIFLDEIGDISPATQVALLRVLQERTFERVGGTEPIHVDVRIIAATHRDLEAMVRNGSFREDLYYRLRGVTVELPPLRNRLGDLGEIAKHLLARIAEERGEQARALSDEALSLLLQHRWPGNVRELENVLRGASLFAESKTLAPDDFAAFRETFVADAAGGSTRSPEEQLYERIRVGSSSLAQVKKTLERECIVRALKEASWNITHAAALLGMKRPRLSQLVKEYGLAFEAQA
jgi:DNA-binding NtrC family response regulator/tetratricopeptide (TPR) repeat protein